MSSAPTVLNDLEKRGEGEGVASRLTFYHGHASLSLG